MFLGFSAIALVLLWKEHRNLYLPDGIVFNRGGIGRRISDGAEVCSFIRELIKPR